MTSYYYATVRTYYTEGGASPLDGSGHIPISQSNVATSNGNAIWVVVAAYVSTTLTTFAQFAAVVPTNGGSTPVGCTLLTRSERTVNVLLNTADAFINLSNDSSKNLNPSTVITSADGNTYNYNSFFNIGLLHGKGVEAGTVMLTPTISITINTDGNTGLPSAINTNNYYYINQTPNAMPTVGWTTQGASPNFKMYKSTILKNSGSVAGSIITQNFWVKGTGSNNGYWIVQIQAPDKVTTTYKSTGTGSTVTTLTGGTPPPATASAALKKAWASLQNKAYQNQQLGLGGTPTNPTVPDPGYQLTVAPTNDDRYNPPPNAISRSISFGERIAFDSAGQAVSPKTIQNLLSSLPNKRERGRIIQDVNSAKGLNTNYDHLTLPSGGTSNPLWGFRFMYNPQTISYSTSSNNSVDWNMSSKDPATLLAGNQNVSLELYINRIVDMAYLLDYSLNPNSVMPITEAYVAPNGKAGLSKEAIDGILHRGTEYDIEFLYRVLNGDPLEKPLLFGNYKGMTSDFGYTTGIPCWLYIHDNMRYFGSITSISVNHLMFNIDMVPMFSTLSIQFTRYPALWSDSVYEAGGYTITNLKAQLQANGTTTSAKSTTGTTATPKAP